MKGRIFLSILLIILLVGGLFLPVKSAVNDKFEPEENPLTVFNTAEEERQAEEESKAAEESQAQKEEMISSLSGSEQSAYAWAALHSDPEFTLMTPERISDYNAKVVKATGMIDVSKDSEPSPEKIVKWMKKNSTLVPDEFPDLDTAIANENREGVYHGVQYGVITTRTELKALPSSEDLNPTIVRLMASSPVQVLHTSTDFAWQYIASRYGRGWVPVENVAIASSQEIWLTYVQPESSAVITCDSVKAEEKLLDMGSLFTCLEENGDSYTVILPVAKKDGSLDSITTSIERESCNQGYVDYTWTRLFKQLFRYADTSAKKMVTNDEMIRNIYLTFGILMPADIASNFDSLGTVTELSGVSGDELDTLLTSLTAPSLIQDEEGIGFVLGRKDGKWYKFTVREDGTAGEAVINGPVKVVTIG